MHYPKSYNIEKETETQCFQQWYYVIGSGGCPMVNGIAGKSGT